jgi:hypothetical protein
MTGSKIGSDSGRYAVAGSKVLLNDRRCSSAESRSTKRVRSRKGAHRPRRMPNNCSAGQRNSAATSFVSLIIPTTNIWSAWPIRSGYSCGKRSLSIGRSIENSATYANAEQQLTAMIVRDRNRASVIVWSMANETPVSDLRNIIPVETRCTRSIAGPHTIHQRRTGTAK